MKTQLNVLLLNLVTSEIKNTKLDKVVLTEARTLSSSELIKQINASFPLDTKQNALKIKALHVKIRKWSSRQDIAQKAGKKDFIKGLNGFTLSADGNEYTLIKTDVLTEKQAEKATEQAEKDDKIEMDKQAKIELDLALSDDNIIAMLNAYVKKNNATKLIALLNHNGFTSTTKIAPSAKVTQASKKQA